MNEIDMDKAKLQRRISDAEKSTMNLIGKFVEILSFATDGECRDSSESEEEIKQKIYNARRAKEDELKKEKEEAEKQAVEYGTKLKWLLLYTTKGKVGDLKLSIEEMKEQVDRWKDSAWPGEEREDRRDCEKLRIDHDAAVTENAQLRLMVNQQQRIIDAYQKMMDACVVMRGE